MLILKAEVLWGRDSAGTGTEPGADCRAATESGATAAAVLCLTPSPMLCLTPSPMLLMTLPSQETVPITELGVEVPTQP